MGVSPFVKFLSSSITTFLNSIIPNPQILSSSGYSIKPLYWWDIMLRFDDTNSDEQLAKLRQKEEEEFLQIMAAKYGIPYADLSGVPVDAAAVGLIKEDLARAALIAPFELANKKLKVGLFSPTQSNTKEVLASLAERGYVVEQYLVSHASLEKVSDGPKEISGATKSEAGMVDISRGEHGGARQEIYLTYRRYKSPRNNSY